MSAGLGIGYKNLVVDYAYSSKGDLGTMINRITLSYKFDLAKKPVEEVIPVEEETGAEPIEESEEPAEEPGAEESIEGSEPIDEFDKPAE